MGKAYIGSTTDIRKRYSEHETITTNKFARATKQIGVTNLKCDIFETVKYYDKHETYDIENNDTIQYDAIEFNTRRSYKTEQVDI